MRLLARSLWLFALLGFPIGGCNEVTTPSPTLTLTVTGRPAPGEPSGPLEGAQLCQTGTQNCEFSDANGKVTIELPINKEISWTLAKEGYGPKLVGEVTDESFDPDDPIGMRLREEYKIIADRLQTDYPNEGQGFISIRVISGFAGATFRLPDASGKPW
jgi:hypothetical protein